jgi:hypothetical protein
VLNAFNGVLRIQNAGGTQVFHGTINVGQFPNVVDIPNAVLHNRGAINLVPGNFNALGIIQEGTVTIGGGLSRFGEYGSGIEFRSGGTTTLNGSLQVVGSAVVRSGAVIEGPGMLVIYPESHLPLGDGALLGSGVHNNLAHWR